MLAPEGDSTSSTNVIWRFTPSGSWERTVYPNAFRSIHREPNGDLIAGDTSGNVWLLENGSQDNGANINVEIRTPVDDGGEPLNRKDAFDLQFHADTGDLPALINVYLDSSTIAAATFTATTSNASVYRFNASRLGTFLRAQVKITGNFHRFVMQAFNLTYRKRPQQVMYIDTGAISAAEPGRFSWLRQVEVDCISPADLKLLIYIDDVLVETLPITVLPNRRHNYRVSLPRGVKGSRPRLVIQTTASDAAGNVGFEPYAVRIKTANSGNESDRNFANVWPTGEQLT
jgi:hypothetical protein